MQPITQVEARDIQRLSATDLVRLLHTLLCAEARRRNIGKTGIHVPYEITVPDGGSDGQWKGEIAENDYIPKSFTVYQSKAQELDPAECAKEIHVNKKEELKPQVKKVLDEGGAYVFFCSHPYNPEQIVPRIAAAREALRDAGRATWETDVIRFLDGNLIAQWVNQHASAFAFVCRCTSRWQAVALRDFAHWSGEPLFQYEFQSNAVLEGFISDIRLTLSEPKGIARITGPSGLGKTRLGFEVFNAKSQGVLEKIRASLALSVVYLDMQVYGRGVLGWVNQLAQYGYSGIIAVDNCSRLDHNLLEQAVRHPDSRLSLLTLDYVPEVPFGDSALQIQLTPEIMRSVVPKILGSVPGLKEKLGDAGIQRVSTFAHGFPQIAILTATAEHALDLTTLNQQGELANRLLWGRGDEDPKAKEIIRCLAPFSEIGISGRYTPQIQFLRAELCGGLSEYDFNKFTRRFRENRVIQDVGDFIMVAPPPLAAALAAEWLNDVSDEHFQELLPKIAESGLTESFCKRLRELDFSCRAQELCARLMGPKGPFSSAEVLNSEVGSRVFRSLSEVNPLAATDCLFRTLNGLPSARLAEFSAGRRDLVWTLEKLVWHQELFSKAARVVRGLAGGETETYSNNATGLFCQIFHVFLPGTRCPLRNRLEIIREGLVFDDPAIRSVCVQALGAALKSQSFSRTSGPEYRGTRPPETDYQPANYREIWDYWKDVFLLLKELILNRDPLSESALAALGTNLGTFLNCPLANELDADFKVIADSQSRYWPVAREEIKRIAELLELNNAEPNPLLQQWLNYVTPTDLRNRLIDTVSTPGWHFREEAGGKFIDLSEEGAVKLAEELSRTGVDWIPHIDCLFEGEQQKSWQFGRRCLELSSDPKGLFEACLNAYLSYGGGKRDPQLLRGMINFFAGTGIACEILDRVATDPGLRADLLIPLTTAAATNVADFERVASLIVAGDLQPASINCFAFGSITNEFDNATFQTALVDLSNKVPETAPYILHVVSMHGLHNEARMRAMASLLSRLVVMPEIISKVGTSIIGHSWKSCVECLLGDPPDGFVQRLSSTLIESLEQISIFSVEDSYISGIANKLLRNHAKLAWPIFASALRTENGEPRFAVVELLARTGRYGDAKTPIWELPEAQFREWAEQNRDLLPYFIERMPLYSLETHSTLSTEEPTDGEDESSIQEFEEESLGIAKNERYAWHPYARILIDLCGRDAVRDALDSNLFSFSSRGSRVPYLQRRVKLMQDLEKTDDPKLKRIASGMIDDLTATIEVERKRDEQHAAGIHVW